MLKNEFISKEEIEQSLNFQLTDKCFLCTYHPVTLSNMSSETQVLNLLEALDDYKDYHIIFTYSNSDTSSQIIIKRIQEYVDRNEGRCMFIPSLGQRRYFSALKYMTAVIGNSSSGIIEVPSFGIPTLDIGDRQKGRISADSVIHCGYSTEEIMEGLKKVVAHKKIDNPYYKEVLVKPAECHQDLSFECWYRNILRFMNGVIGLGSMGKRRIRLLSEHKICLGIWPGEPLCRNERSLA